MRAVVRSVLPVLLLIIVFPARLPAQEEPRSTGMLVEIPVSMTLIAGGERQRIVPRVRIDDEMRLIALEAAPILNALEGIVLPDILDRLRDRSTENWLAPADLESQGLGVHFDRYQLSAEVRVPVTALGTQVLSLFQPRVLPGFVEAENAAIALGLPAWTQYRSTRPVEGEAISAVSVRVSPGLHVYDWVLESDLRLAWQNLEEGNDPEYGAENTRLVRIWEDRGTRLQAGQFTQFTRGLQAPSRLLGLSLDNLRADTGRGPVPALFERPLIVDESGQIDVFLNERRIRTFPVQPGQYELQDLPLAAGINTARVEYTRDSGVTERYDLVFPNAGGLLATGAFSYAAALGVEEEDMEAVAGSGYVRYGFADTLTAGLLLDGSVRGVQAGTEMVGATRVGEPSAAAFVSMDDEYTLGWAIQAGYRVALPGRAAFPRLAATVEYRDPDHTQPGASRRGAAQAFQVSSALSQSLPGRTGLSVGHVYRTYHDDQRDSSVLFASLSRNVGRRMGLRVTGTVDTTDPEEFWTLQFLLSTRALQRNMSGTVTVDARNQAMDLSGSATRRGPVTLSTNARVSSIDLTSGTVAGVGGGARAAGARFDLAGSGGLRFTEADALSDQELQTAYYSLQAGTGLYIAGGLVGLGAPTRSSFALVRPDPALPTDTVAVKTGGTGIPRESGRFSPAFIAPLSPGARTPITVDVPGIPADYSLGTTDFILAPGYRSGTAITIISVRRLYVRGQLVDSGGRPIAYKGFVVNPTFEVPTELDDPPPGGASFTDDRGTFEVYGLIPGEYEILLRDGSARRAIFTVPDEPGPLVTIDEIRLEGETR